MTTITAMTEDFTGGAVGVDLTTSNTHFTDSTGTSTAAKFIVDPYDATLRMAEITTTAQFRTLGMNFTAIPLLWYCFDLDIVTALDTNTAISNGYDTNANVNKFFDLRLTTTNNLQLRDGSSTVATSGALAVGTKHRVYVKCQCSATAGITNRSLRFLVYSGGDNTTLTYDSGEVTLSQAITAIGNVKFGTISNATGKIRIGRIRGDNAVQPVPAATGTVTLAVDKPAAVVGDTVTLTATTTGTGTLAWTQSAGTAVTLSGAATDLVRTYTAAAGTVSFSASYGGSTSATVSSSATSVSLGASTLTPAAGTTVTLTATTTGSDTLTFTQTAGTAVTLSGTGTTRTFTAEGGVTYGFTATYGAATSNTVTIVTAATITPTVSLAASSTTPSDGATVTLTATTTGTGTLVFTQTSGTTLTLSGTGNTRTFTAVGGQTYAFQATYGGASSNTVTVVTSAAAAATVSLTASSTTPAAGSTVTLTAATTGTGTLVFTQTAGTAVTLSGSGTIRTFTAGASQTYSFQATFGGASSAVITVVSAAATTTITELVEDFTGGAPGVTIATGNTIFDTILGTAGATFVVDPYDGTRQMMQVTSTANFRAAQMDYTPRALTWFRFDLDIDSIDTTSAILSGYDTSAIVNKFFDIRLSTTNTLSLRDGNSTVATSGVLAVGTKHRVYVKVAQSATPGSGTLRMLVYSGGDNTLMTYDSGDQMLSQAVAPTMGHLRTGIISTATGSLRLGRFRADYAVQPLPAPTGTVTLAVNNASPTSGDIVTLTATTTGTGTLAFTQTAGVPVTLSGTGTTRTFTVGTGAVTFTATYGGTTSGSVTVTPFVPPSVNAGVDQTKEGGTVVTLTATTAGSGTLTWVVVPTAGGAALALGGSGNVRTFTAPPSMTEVTYTGTATYGGVTDTVVVTVPPFLTWIKRAGVLKAYLPARKV